MSTRPHGARRRRSIGLADDDVVYLAFGGSAARSSSLPCSTPSLAPAPAPTPACSRRAPRHVPRLGRAGDKCRRQAGVVARFGTCPPRGRAAQRASDATVIGYQILNSAYCRPQSRSRRTGAPWPAPAGGALKPRRHRHGRRHRPNWRRSSDVLDRLHGMITQNDLRTRAARTATLVGSMAESFRRSSSTSWAPADLTRHIDDRDRLRAVGR